MAKSPLEAIDEMLTADELMLVTVTTFPALVVPNTSLPKLKVPGDRLRTGSITKLAE
jgi:hypothetical protein